MVIVACCGFDLQRNMDDTRRYGMTKQMFTITTLNMGVGLFIYLPIYPLLNTNITSSRIAMPLLSCSPRVLRSVPEFNNLRAVKTGRLYCAEGSKLFALPGPSTLQAVKPFYVLRDIDSSYYVSFNIPDVVFRLVHWQCACLRAMK